MRCPFVLRSICHVRVFCRNESSNFFTVGRRRLATTLLYQYSDGDPPNMGVESDGVGKMAIFNYYNGFGIDNDWTVGCRQHFDGGIRVKQLAVAFVDRGRRRNAIIGECCL